MGVFSEIAMEQQNSMFDSSAAFEDDEAFELEEMESLPVPPVGTDTVPVSAASVSAGETALADAEEEPADEVAPAGEEKSAEEGNSAQPPAAEDEEKKRAEHEAAEAQRKAEFDAKQQAKKAAEQEQIARLEAMSDEEVIAASTQRVSTDVEKLTRRNMKECVSEHIQMLCMEDTAFARLTMHPKKNMIRCFQYINRKAWDYVQDELKASGTRPGPGQQTYGCDVPDDMCYQWAEDYFRDPDAKEDHEDEEKFVPKPYIPVRTLCTLFQEQYAQLSSYSKSDRICISTKLSSPSFLKLLSVSSCLIHNPTQKASRCPSLQGHCILKELLFPHTRGILFL